MLIILFYFFIYSCLDESGFVSELVEDELLVEDPVDEVVDEELELDDTVLVVIFIVVSNGIMTLGRTFPFLSTACSGTEAE